MLFLWGFQQHAGYQDHVCHGKMLREMKKHEQRRTLISFDNLDLEVTQHLLDHMLFNKTVTMPY